MSRWPILGNQKPARKMASPTWAVAQRESPRARKRKANRKERKPPLGKFMLLRKVQGIRRIRKMQLHGKEEKESMVRHQSESPTLWAKVGSGAPSRKRAPEVQKVAKVTALQRQMESSPGIAS